MQRPATEFAQHRRALSDLPPNEVVSVGDHWAALLVDDGVRLAIAHVFDAGRRPEARVRLFARWLRSHPDDRDHYAALRTAAGTPPGRPRHRSW